MTPARLAEIGVLLYGPHWQQPMGVALHVARRTVQRWVSGAEEIPAGLAYEIADLCRYRAAKMIEAAEGL